MPRILVVCTGNICRSPAAELLLARDLRGLAEVSSAGTGALVGHPVDFDTSLLLEERGVTTAGFRARQVTAQMVRDADLVLVAAREHRAAVLQLAPVAVRRTFTLLEFARLASAVAPQPGGGCRLESLVQAAAAARSHHRGPMDVADPYRRGPDAHLESVTTIERAVSQIAAALHAA